MTLPVKNLLQEGAFKVALVFAPQGEPAMPHLALPLLKAYIEERAPVQADLYDLNLALYRWLLSRAGITSLLAMLKGPETPGVRGKTGGSSCHRNLARDVPGALAVLDGRVPDMTRYAWALDRVADACSLFSHAHPRYTLSLKNLSLQDWDGSSEGLLSYVDDPANPFTSFFGPYIEQLASYNVVGLTLAWTGQLLPVFLLARLLKQRVPGLKVILGGSLVPHFLETFLGSRDLMRDMDHIVPFEGEQPLAELLLAMIEGRNPAAVDGVFSLDRRAGVFQAPACQSVPVPGGSLPTPDFTGLPLKHYLSPGICLPIIASRGCYYGRCNFCDHFHHVTKHVVRPMARVLADLHILRERCGARDFFFVDDCLPVPVLRGLADGLKAGGEKEVRFIAEMRLEPDLTRSLLNDAASSGCHALLFGLESGCQETLDRMRKGIDLNTGLRVLKDAHDVGVLTWCFFMVGYPGESIDEIKTTLRLLAEKRSDIDIIAGGPFIMTRHAPVACASPPAGLTMDGTPADLSLACAWKHFGSPARNEVRKVLDDADEMLGEMYPRLAYFVETHMFAFRQEDYRDMLIRMTGCGPRERGQSPGFRPFAWLRRLLLPFHREA